MFVTGARIAGGVLLLAIAAIHLFLVADGVGGLLGVLFVLNGIAGIVLGVGVLALRGRWRPVAVALGLLFSIASLLALLLALTVGLFGIREVWTFTLVPETVVVDVAAVLALGAASTAAARSVTGRR